MDRLTVVRSLTHPYPLHGTVYAMTRIPDVDTKIEVRPRDPRQWPFIGSVVDYLDDRRSGGKPPAVPRNVALPFPLGSRTEIPPLAGPDGTWLGARYDPVFTDFAAEGTRPAPSVRGRAFPDPYLLPGLRRWRHRPRPPGRRHRRRRRRRARDADLAQGRAGDGVPPPGH
jgi:hypothetical protein